MQKGNGLHCIGIGALLLCSFWARAVPTVISHQGVVYVQGERFTGDGAFRFAIVQIATGNSVWTNDGTQLGTMDAPVAAVTIAVELGVYTVLLGDDTIPNMTPLSANVFATDELALRIWFDDGTNGVQLLTPDQSLSTAPYAFRAEKAASATTAEVAEAAQTGSIDSGMIADGAVTATDLQDGAALLEIADDDGTGSGLDADQLDGLEATQFWNRAGNSATSGGTDFIGTTDAQDLVFKVNNAQALRLEPGDSPNLIGGYSGNEVLSSVIAATIAGGGENSYPNRVTDTHGSVGGGRNNTAGDGAGTISDAAYATVSGGAGNTAGALYASVGGGQQNSASSVYATVSGGYQNTITQGTDHTIGGGQGNSIASFTGHSTIAGGYQNDIQDDSATIGGGEDNTVSGAAATIAGGSTNVASGDYSTVTGGANNSTSALYAQVGGWMNTTAGDYSVINGGLANTISSLGDSGTIGGGGSNQVSKQYATVSGGQNNSATEAGATVAGGASNEATGDYAAVVGGFTNTAPGLYATVLGGYNNTASGKYALAFGEDCTASAETSIALGSMAQAQHIGAFVWSDEGSGVAGATSRAANTFTIRATGGVYIETAVDTSGNATAGIELPAGASAWQALSFPSDRNKKEAFEEIDPAAILDAVINLPLKEWQYTNQTHVIRHIGPMAQDFHEAFGVGESDQLIHPLDTAGVSLAAIQQLHVEITEKEATIQSQAKQIEALEARLTALEAHVLKAQSR